MGVGQNIMELKQEKAELQRVADDLVFLIDSANAQMIVLTKRLRDAQMIILTSLPHAVRVCALKADQPDFFHFWQTLDDAVQYFTLWTNSYE